MTDNNGGNGNGEKPKHPGGKPRRYQNPDEFEKIVVQYFQECEDNKIEKQVVTGRGEVVTLKLRKPRTMAGLARALGIARDTLNNYKYYEDRPEFLAVIERARAQIEEENVDYAMSGLHDARIAALNLASNYGYHTSEQQTIKGNLTLSAISFDGWTERQISDYLTHGLLPGQPQEAVKALAAGGQETETT